MAINNFPEPAQGTDFLQPVGRTDNPQQAGQITSRQLYIGLIENEGGYDTTDEDLRVTVIGGLGDGVLSVNKQNIPVGEIGSDEWVIVDSRPQPFNMQLNKIFVNGKNLLASLLTEKEMEQARASQKTDKILMNLAQEYFKKPRDFVIMVYNSYDTSARAYAVLKNTTIVNYSVAIQASQETIFENASLMGSLIKDQRVEELNSK